MWPLIVPVLILVTYELVAAGTQVFHTKRRISTISELVWRMSSQWTLAQRLTVSAAILVSAFVLVLHLFFGLWRY